MRIQKRIAVSLLACGFLPFIAAASYGAAPAATWQAGVSLYTESGDYGTDSKSSLLYIPFSLRRYIGPGDLELIVPFLSVTSQGQVVLVEGVPNRARISRSGTRVSEETHSGLGDIVLKGRYYLVEEGDKIPSIDAIGKIKFPTASRGNGLGTGEFDEGGSLELTKTIKTQYVALGDVGYMIIGSQPGLELRNQWHYSLGGGYYFLPNKLLGTLTYEEYRSLVAGETNPRDLLFAASYTVNLRLRVDGGITVGVSSAAPDYGVNLGAHLKF